MELRLGPPPEHVHEVLGLPIGDIDINVQDFPSNKKSNDKWKKQFENNSLSVRIGELKSYVKSHSHRSGGPMFKCNFVVLCVSTLMSGNFLHCFATLIDLMFTLYSLT